MRRFHFITVWPIVLLTCTVFLVFSSCVTKRKYLVMEESKNSAENRMKELASEIETTKKNFEDYQITSKNDLASKQMTVDSLSRIISNLNTDLSSKDNNIEDQVFSFQLEKNKLSLELSEKDRDIRNLTREINTLKVQIDDLNKKLEDVTSNRKFPFGQVKQLERKLQARDSEISELNIKLGNAQSKNDSLVAKTNELTIEIERLSEIVNPQKLDSIRNE